MYPDTPATLHDGSCERKPTPGSLLFRGIWEDEREEEEVPEEEYEEEGKGRGAGAEDDGKGDVFSLASGKSTCIIQLVVALFTVVLDDSAVIVATYGK